MLDRFRLKTKIVAVEMVERSSFDAYFQRLVSSCLGLIGCGLRGVDSVGDVFVGVDGIDGVAHVSTPAGVPHSAGEERETSEG